MTSTPPGQSGSEPPPEDRFDPYRYGRPDPDPAPDWTTRRIPRAGEQPGHTDPDAPSHSDPWGQRPVGPGQYPGAAPYGYGAPAHKSGTNGMAIAGFVLGLLSVILCFLTFFDGLFVVLGVVFSVIGLSATKRGRGGRGLAITGIVLSVIGAIAAAAIVYFVFPTAKDCADKYGTGSSQYENCVKDRFR